MRPSRPLAAAALAALLLAAQSARADPPDDTWSHPAKAADPPELPRPAPAPAPAPSPRPDLPPTSTSGTDIVPPAPPLLPPIVVTDHTAEAAQQARLQALEDRAARDEAHIRSLEERLRDRTHLQIHGYVQPQLIVQSFNTAASPNLQPNGLLPPGVTANDTIARSDGSTTNQTFFRIRRARLTTTWEAEPVRLFLQLDGLPEGGVGPGIGTILRNAEATVIARWTEDVRTEVTAGLFLTPFRRELLEWSVDRPFIERTWFVQNVFPTERDYGVHARTIADRGRLAVDVALINGQGLGTTTFVSLPDLNGSKDLIGYATYRLGVLTFGASGYLGRNQLIDRTALSFKQFTKWALNVEASADARLFPVGASRISSELTFGENMDTGAIYAFALPRAPAVIGEDVGDVHERALYIRLEQDFGRHVTAGYRYDMYAPDTSLGNDARDTHAFLLVGKLGRHLRWMNELGFAIDNVHPSGGEAPSKHVLYFSSVLQAMF